MPTKILFAGDGSSNLSALLSAFRLAGLNVEYFTRPEDLLCHLREQGADLVVSDMHVQGTDGVDLLRTIHQQNPQVFRVLFSCAVAGKKFRTALEQRIIERWFDKNNGHNELIRYLKEFGNHAYTAVI